MAVTWLALGARTVRATTTALTEDAPSSSAQGMALHGVKSILPVVSAPSGQTFDGTGTWRGYVYSDYVAAWVRAPMADLDMTDAADLEVVAFPAIEVGQSQGRFALVPDGIGVSGGTALTLTLIAAGRFGDSAL